MYGWLYNYLAGTEEVPSGSKGAVWVAGTLRYADPSEPLYSRLLFAYYRIRTLAGFYAEIVSGRIFSAGRQNGDWEYTE